MNRSTPGLLVHHQLPEFTQTHLHWVGDAIQPSHPLSSPFPPALNPSQNQSLFQWVNSSHEVAKVLEFQLQHQSFQWTPRTYLLQDGLVGSPCHRKPDKTLPKKKKNHRSISMVNINTKLHQNNRKPTFIKSILYPDRVAFIHQMQW